MLRFVTTNICMQRTVFVSDFDHWLQPSLALSSFCNMYLAGFSLFLIL